MSRSFLFSALLSAPLFAQTTSPSISVYNAASHFAFIAPGSFAAVNVGAIGNATPDLMVDLTTSDGARVALTPIAPPTAPGVLNTTETWVVIPRNAPIGSAVLTATMGGAAYHTTVDILPRSPGIFTAAYDGGGPALALNYPDTRNALTSAAVPNSIVTLFATGLDGATTANLTVNVGGQAVTPLYVGPQGQPGLDQINFVIPANTPIGCYVALTVTQGITSNVATLSINPDPYACAHPLGLSYSQMKTLDAGGTINLARFVIAAADVSAVNRTSTESASLNFVPALSKDVAAFSGLQGVPIQQQVMGPSGFCFVDPNLESGSAGPGSFITDFSAGAVTLAGPGGKQLQLNQNRSYGAQAPTDQLPFFTGGNWTLSATGAIAVSAFTQNIQLPQRLKFTNLNENTIAPGPSGDYTLRWDPSGFRYGDVINLSFITKSQFSTTCTVSAVDGQADIPELIFDAYKGKTMTIVSTVQPAPETRTLFTVPYKLGEPIRGFADYYFTQGISVQVQ